MKLVQNKFARYALLVLGIFSLILGFIGVFMPVMPTAPFVILAVWCFARSWHWAHKWIYRQPLLNKHLRNWDEQRAISRSAKTLAILAMTVSLISTWLTLPFLWAKLAISAFLFSAAMFISTRPDAKESKNDKAQ